MKKLSVLTLVELKKLYRAPLNLAIMVLMPVGLALIFYLALSNVYNDYYPVPGMNHFEYLLPGVMGYAVIYMGMMVAISLCDYRNDGILDRVQTTPVSAGTYLGSHIIANMIIATGQGLIVLLVAWLEAMQEGQVTLEGDTLKLDQPFIVIATQNPIEYEGTFPLPEAQLDRFIARMRIGYPQPAEEKEILERRLRRKDDGFVLQPVVDPGIFSAMRQCIEDVYVEPDIQHYIVELVTKLRAHRQVVVGASPRGSLALMKLSRAWAAIHGRNYIVPDDVRDFAHEILGHRVILEPSLWGSKTTEYTVIDEIVHSLDVPVLPRNI